MVAGSNPAGGIAPALFDAALHLDLAEVDRLTPGVVVPYLPGDIHSTHAAEGPGVVFRFLSYDLEKIARNRKYFGEFDPFGDFDLLFGAAKLNLKIVDIPVRYRERKYGSTNIRRFSHGWLLLRMVVYAARKIKFV